MEFKKNKLICEHAQEKGRYVSIGKTKTGEFIKVSQVQRWVCEECKCVFFENELTGETNKYPFTLTAPGFALKGDGAGF